MKLNRKTLRKMILKEIKNLSEARGASQYYQRSAADDLRGKGYDDFENGVENGIFTSSDGTFSHDIHMAHGKYMTAIRYGLLEPGMVFGMPAGVAWIQTNLLKDNSNSGAAFTAAKDLQRAILNYDNYLKSAGTSHNINLGRFLDD